jgi:hypothetical protein
MVFAEYDRTRKKEVAKQQRERAERQEIMGRAREEREVRRRAGRRQRAAWGAHRRVPPGCARLQSVRPRSAPATPLPRPPLPPPCCPAPQRLMAENLQQQQLIEALVARVDRVEGLLHEWEEAQRRREQRSAWGGFFGTRGLEQGG